MKKIFFLILSIYLLIPFLDKSLYIKTELEQNQINNRYVYFSNEMGVFYTRNIAIRFYLNRIFPFANKYFYEISHYKLAHPK